MTIQNEKRALIPGNGNHERELLMMSRVRVLAAVAALARAEPLSDGELGRFDLRAPLELLT
jgi:hypothetical protein